MWTKFRGWRTVSANIAMSIVPFLELTEVKDVLPDEWLPFYALTMAIINVWLRTQTTTPVGKKY